MTKTEQELEKLIKPIVEQLGYELYDVMYLKESSDWYLRIFIDSKDGIDLDDCEKVSDNVGEMLDTVDPIPTQYNLEVSSCGICRHLREPRHFETAIGENIEIKLYKSFIGEKEFDGELSKFENGEVTLKKDNEEIVINYNDISSAKILFDWEELKNE